jgi:hypothetical protein
MALKFPAAILRVQNRNATFYVNIATFCARNIWFTTTLPSLQYSALCRLNAARNLWNVPYIWSLDENWTLIWVITTSSQLINCGPTTLHHSKTFGIVANLMGWLFTRSGSTKHLTKLLEFNDCSIKRCFPRHTLVRKEKHVHRNLDSSFSSGSSKRMIDTGKQ